MAKLVLDDAVENNIKAVSAFNLNFQKLNDALQNKLLFRDNPVGEPNSLESDIDANGSRIYNLPEPKSDTEAARLKDIKVYAQFPGFLYGPSSVDPLVRTDGSALQEGDLYFNTTNLQLMVFSTQNGWEYIGLDAEQSAASALSSKNAAYVSETNAHASEVAAGTSETNAHNSELAAGISEGNASASAASAQDWAIKTNAPVSGGEYSAKWWAQMAANAIGSAIFVTDTTEGMNQTTSGEFFWVASVGGLILYQNTGSATQMYKFGTAATVDTGTALGEIPKNSDLGSAAFSSSSAFIPAASSADFVQKAGDTLTGGFTGPSSVDDGTKSSGTYTPSPTTGNWRKISMTGSITLAAPTVSGCYNMTIDITNGSSGSKTLSFSGFVSGFPKGDPYANNNGYKFKVHIAKSDAGVTGFIEALQ